MGNNNVQKAREGFEDSFKEGSFYNRQTRDKQHLRSILAALQLRDGTQLLDLGTGSGEWGLVCPFQKQSQKPTTAA